MEELYVVRHADAGPRGGRDQPDDRRPLSERGQRQAKGLCGSLGDAGITRLLASPFRRCIETLVPLGEQLGIEVEVDDRLAEGTGALGVLAIADEVRGTNAVLCSHGDVIPDVLDALLARGVELRDELRWKKASTWAFTWHDGRLAEGRYVPPPV